MVDHIEDLEYNKFELNSGWDVIVDFDQATANPLVDPEWNRDDLESAKFSGSKIGAVFTN